MPSIAGFPPQLLEGYKTFSENRLPRERERFEELAASGQKPKVMLIGCCDLRVSPEVIFDARPGRDLRRPQRRQPDPAL